MRGARGARSGRGGRGFSSRAPAGARCRREPRRSLDIWPSAASRRGQAMRAPGGCIAPADHSQISLRHGRREAGMIVPSILTVIPSKRLATSDRIAPGGMSTKVLCMTLTLKQARLAAEYIVDLNGRKAAIRARYSAKTAEVQASRLLRKATAQTAVEEAMQARSGRTGIKAD